MTATRTGTACTWCSQQAGIVELDGRCARCVAVIQVQDRILGKRWCRVCGEKLVYPRGKNQHNQRKASEDAVHNALIMLCDKPKCRESVAW